MGKYSEIVESSWVDMTLYAESIPHLLHWDLAYLWILEKDHLRPEAWEERIEAWRYLVGLFIIGELELEEEAIPTPFLTHTQPYGINKVTWVRLKNSPHRVGVLSPTVLVRPLPDFKDADIRQWKKIVSDLTDAREDALKHFVNLIVRRLRDGQRGDNFRTKLANILEREFNPRPMAHPTGGALQSVQLLSRLTWAQEPDGPCMENVDILVLKAVGGTHRAEKSYIPYCSSCGHPLTLVADAPPIVVTEEQFQLLCKNSDCGEPNSLSLSNFLIWLRGRDRVVVWRRQGFLDPLEKGFPPDPVIQNNIDVVFEWGPAQVGGDLFRRFLKLRFPERDITEHRYPEIFYTKILVPGEMEKFTGLPVRAEWLDALNPAGHEIEVQERGKVLYKGLDIKGWPERLRWPAAILKRDPALAVGVYPNPGEMPDEWKLYRAFLAGDTRRGYHFSAGWGREVLPWLRESEDGPPPYLSVVDGNEQGVGVTYWLNRASRPLAQRSPTNVYVGLDIGTTNTLIYSMSENQVSESPDPSIHGLKPSELHKGVGWVAGSLGEHPPNTVGDFLPAPAYATQQPDPYIIPSALWEFHSNTGQQHFIRWAPEPPAEGARPISDFKLDRGGDHSERREAFVRELFRLVLPHILRSATLSAPVRFRVGVAFPLTFDYNARKARMELMERLGKRLGSDYYRFDFYSIDESHACVRALGDPNPSDTFLVADMGGGTTDLALVKGEYVLQLSGHGAEGANSIEPIQIGSIEFAGGDFMRALVSKKPGDKDERDRLGWELRDLITQGRCYEQYGSDAAAHTVLNRLTAIAFEFLRTMVAALQQHEQPTKINLVLVGNGWHLAEAFSSDTGRRDAKYVFNQYYNHLVEFINSGSLQFLSSASNEGRLLQKLPSSKHLVVIGALQNTVAESKGTKDDGGRPLTLSKLPAGRDMSIRTRDTNRTKAVLWNERVGEDVPWQGYTEKELTEGEFTFDFEADTGITGAWFQYLLTTFGMGNQRILPYPSTMEMKRAASRNIQGNPPKMHKGPLQIIIESTWKDKLKD